MGRVDPEEAAGVALEYLRDSGKLQGMRRRLQALQAGCRLPPPRLGGTVQAQGAEPPKP